MGKQKRKRKQIPNSMVREEPEKEKVLKFKDPYEYPKYVEGDTVFFFQYIAGKEQNDIATREKIVGTVLSQELGPHVVPRYRVITDDGVFSVPVLCLYREGP